MWHNSDVTLKLHLVITSFALFNSASHYEKTIVNCDLLSHYEKLKLTVNIEMIMKMQKERNLSFTWQLSWQVKNKILIKNIVRWLVIIMAFYLIYNLYWFYISKLRLFYVIVVISTFSFTIYQRIIIVQLLNRVTCFSSFSLNCYSTTGVGTVDPGGPLSCRV